MIISKHSVVFGYLHLLYGQLVGQTPELATGNKTCNYVILLQNVGCE